MPIVEVRGEGLAACACAALLRRKGFPIVVDRNRRSKLPAILANRATQSLLGDIFADRGLFDGLRQISQRIVAWGNPDEGVPAISVPHSAAVLSEQELLEVLWERVGLNDTGASKVPEWIVAGSRSCQISSDEKKFGSREAIASPVELTASAPRDAFWIESVRSGWLFLLPVGLSPTEDTHAMLIAVGNETEALLEESQVVRKVIGRQAGREEATVHGDDRRIFCSPRISTALASMGRIACGTAAMSFDPISGEGAGHAAREAILAAAVIDGVNRGLPADRLVTHYTARLMAGFQRHLEICLRFYNQARSGPWWEQEIELLHEGIAWCGANIDVAAVREFQLVDFELQPRN